MQKGGRRILLAGGRSKIGAAIASRLAGTGDHVTVFGRDAGQAQGAPYTSEDVQFMRGDVLDAQDRQRLSEALAAEGGLDALVVTIGALHVARLSETTDAAWDGVLDANLVAPFLIAQTSLPLLRDSGAVVFVGSGTAQRPDMELGAYSVAKRALERMAQVLAMEAALRGIRVNTVNPGEMEEPMTVMAAPPLRSLLSTPIPPLGRRGNPEDVAGAVEFFLSEASSFCTGASLTLDGGLRAALRSQKVRQ